MGRPNFGWAASHGEKVFYLGGKRGILHLSKALRSSPTPPSLGASMHLCICKFVVVQVEAHNLLEIINRGSIKLAINKLARHLFWFCLANGITLSVEWVPREENAFADEMSKLLIPDDWKLTPKFFNLLEARWALHSTLVLIQCIEGARDVLEEMWDKGLTIPR